MTDDNAFEAELAPHQSEEQTPLVASGASRQTPPAREPGHDMQKANEIASLVLLINTILGGLGTLYATTKSTQITLAAALLVFLITIVVLVVRRVITPGDSPSPQGEDSRSGE
ncbi:hypothetical protein PV396_43990 [Streptomyces sp. ME02-8801-2C]|uniref:hypothetical protein n=1 Tax=Streptomyces sp. ME02-8801-2C TaxID=3028680 RepID=UPI0029BA6A6A|nr:hypothetical protein [Streptomyces sp. ME02-8801-2C]MDX3458807.1 hypothetical protein [Streptomyces sp. ME02-8801-2C]